MLARPCALNWEWADRWHGTPNYPQVGVCARPLGEVMGAWRGMGGGGPRAPNADSHADPQSAPVLVVGHTVQMGGQNV